MAKSTTKSIKVYFATNRDGPHTKNGQVTFGNSFQDNSACYRVGSALVKNKGASYQFDKLTVQDETPSDSGEDSTATLGSNAMFREIKKVMKDEGRDLIVLIHGFSSGMDTALERAAELSQKYKVRGKDGKLKQPIALVFSWPSKGKMIPFASYISDRDYAEKSGKAIGRLFLRLYDFLLSEAVQERRNRDDDAARALHEPCPGRIHLVAHSMGNWALRHAVQKIVAEKGRHHLPIVFDNIFLMAADANDDVLSMPEKAGPQDGMWPLTRLGNAVHVYHSKDDQALVVSDVTKLNPDRLGHNGPVDMDATDSKVVAIDCRHVDVTGFTDTNHQYYRLRKEVLADVRQVLEGALPQQVTGRTPLSHPRRYMINKPKKKPVSHAPTGSHH